MSNSTSSFKTAFVALVFAGFIGSSAALGQNPIISVSSPSVIFNYTVGAGTPASQNVTVTSNLPATITAASVTYTGPTTGWLTLLPPLGGGMATPVTLNLFVNPATLAVGTYVAQIQLSTAAPVDPSSATSIAVFLVVAAAGSGGPMNETLTVSPTSLTFSWQAGGAVPAAQMLSLSTSDNASVNITAQTNDGSPWLLLSAPTSVTPGGVNVSVNPAGLAGGAYTGTIIITAPNTVAQVTVSFTVGGTALTVNPATLSFNVPQNYGFSAPQVLQVTSSAAVTVMAFATSDQNWLIVDPPTATTPATFTVKANDSSLPQGTYQGSVTVQAGPSNSMQVPVTLTVGPPAVLQLQPGSLSFSYQIGALATPASQTVKINAINSTSAQPFTVASTTNDGASWLKATAAPGTTPGVVTVSVIPTGLAAGSYSGTVNVTPTAANSSPQPILVSLTVMPVPPPLVSAVTNSASYAAGTVAPGEIVTIFGTGLGPNTIAIPPPGPAPTSLANTSVTFDGLPAPIIYTLATQTTVQVPYGIAIGQTVMKLSSVGGSTAAINLNSVPAFPGLFTVDVSGKGQAAALNQDLSLNSAANPASRGAALVLYGTGEGKTNPPEVEGTITPIVPPFPQVLLPVSVTIGGQAATVAYAGETPGTISGLLQVNVTVPPTAPTGPAVPVQVFINGQPSQGSVTVAIQ